MESDIIDYLTVKNLEDSNFEAPASVRVRKAWMLARNKYLHMTPSERRELHMYILMKRRKYIHD